MEMREELRVELSKLGPRGRGRAYPKGLLEKLLSYTVARRRQGAPLQEVGAELGMNLKTLSRWLGERKQSARFERVLTYGPGGISVVAEKEQVRIRANVTESAVLAALAMAGSLGMDAP